MIKNLGPPNFQNWNTEGALNNSAALGPCSLFEGNFKKLTKVATDSSRMHWTEMNDKEFG